MFSLKKRKQDKEKKYIPHYPAIALSDGELSFSKPFQVIAFTPPNTPSNGAVFGGVNPVLDFIMKHPGIRANQIAGALGIPLRTLQRELSRLKSCNQIEFRGAPKNGGYWIKN